MINALIVEDSELARLELKTQLKVHPNIMLIGEAADVPEAVEMIKELSPDVVFMDIDLPGGNAFDILQQLIIVPKLIFVTAFENFALEAFEHGSVDYLLKPIKSDRLAKAINKLSDHFKETTNLIDQNSQFFVKDGDQCWLVKLGDVRYLEAVGNYSKIYFRDHSPLVYRSLTGIEERVEDNILFRANRKQLVNLKFIKSIEPGDGGMLYLTLECGAELEVSRRQASKFKQLMSL
jgi:two-component system, LytTR family, response regulator